MSDSGKIVFSKSHLIMRVFGLPFFGAGCLMAYMAATGQMENAGGEPTHPIAGLLFALPFLLIGAACMFYRGAVVIDPGRREVIDWWGFLVPISRKITSFDKISAVRITRRVIRSKNRSSVVYLYALVGPEGTKEGEELEIDLASEGSYTKSRKKAEELAGRLHLDLYDSTSGTTVIRERGFMDESIVDRMKRLGEVVEWPELPANSRIQYANIDERAVIDLPPTPGSKLMLLFGLVPLGFMAFAFMSFILPMMMNTGSNMTGLGKWIVLGFLSLFIIIPGTVLFVLFKRSGGAKDRLIISWQGLELERNLKFGGKKTYKLSAEEIEELQLNRDTIVPGTSSAEQAEAVRNIAEAFGRSFGGIVARSDEVTLSFGGSLSAEEQQWLYDAIRFILSHPPQRAAMI